MRLILLLSFVFLFCLPGLTQVGWGIKGGFNMANQKIFISIPDGYGGSLNVKQSGVEIPTFQVGFFAEIPLSKTVSFMPELSLFGKGSNFNGEDSTGNFSTAKLRMHYLEVPLCIVYKHPLKKGELFVGGGPTIGYGLFGKAKNNSHSENIFQPGGFKHLDAGLYFTGGIRLEKGISIGAFYNLGIFNILDPQNTSLQGQGDFKWKNRTWGVTICYFLGHIKK